MAWYYILFFFVLAFFLLKTVITLIFGDTDIDFDADGDVDFDVSSMFSFKGALHFLLGFSTYLSATARFSSACSSDETFQFTWIHFLIATVIGFVFMYGLFKLYTLMMKFNHYNSSNFDVNGYTCSVLINNGLIDIDTPDKELGGHGHAYLYTVLVNTEVGSRKINILSDNGNLAIGSEHKIYRNEDGEYYI